MIVWPQQAVWLATLGQGEIQTPAGGGKLAKGKSNGQNNYLYGLSMRYELDSDPPPIDKDSLRVHVSTDNGDSFDTTGIELTDFGEGTGFRAFDPYADRQLTAHHIVAETDPDRPDNVYVFYTELELRNGVKGTVLYCHIGHDYGDSAADWQDGQGQADRVAIYPPAGIGFPQPAQGYADVPAATLFFTPARRACTTRNRSSCWGAGGGQRVSRVFIHEVYHGNSPTRDIVCID